MTVNSAPPDPPELAHHRARLDRAVEHYKNFGDTWNEYLERRPHRNATTVSPDGRGVIRFSRIEPVPQQLALAFGEFLHQLRAALDNCLYTVAVIDAGQSPPPGGERLQWPICLTPAEWKRNAARYAHLSPEIVDALEAIQPYKTNYPDWNCLRILHDLARIDRHRTLPVVELYNVEGRIRYDATCISEVEIRKGIVTPGDVLVGFTYTGADTLGPEHIDGDFEFDVDLVDVRESIGPFSDEPTRPYGSLAKRMQALYRAVVEYTEGLIDIAQNPNVDYVKPDPD